MKLHCVTFHNNVICNNTVACRSFVMQRLLNEQLYNGVEQSSGLKNPSLVAENSVGLRHQLTLCEDSFL
jgi:hypothetical protein